MPFQKGNKLGNRFSKDNRPDPKSISKAVKKKYNLQKVAKDMLNNALDKATADQDVFKQLYGSSTDASDLTIAHALVARLAKIAIDPKTTNSMAMRAVESIAKLSGDLTPKEENKGSHFTDKPPTEWSESDWSEMAEEMGVDVSKLKSDQGEDFSDYEEVHNELSELDEAGDLDV